MEHDGRFGQFGGYYVPEVLMPALEEMETATSTWPKAQMAPLLQPMSA